MANRSRTNFPCGNQAQCQNEADNFYGAHETSAAMYTTTQDEDLYNQAFVSSTPSTSATRYKRPDQFFDANYTPLSHIRNSPSTSGSRVVQDLSSIPDMNSSYFNCNVSSIQDMRPDYFDRSRMAPPAPTRVRLENAPYNFMDYSHNYPNESGAYYGPPGQRPFIDYPSQYDQSMNSGYYDRSGGAAIQRPPSAPSGTGPPRSLGVRPPPCAIRPAGPQMLPYIRSHHINDTPYTVDDSVDNSSGYYDRNNDMVQRCSPAVRNIGGFQALNRSHTSPGVDFNIPSDGVTSHQQNFGMRSGPAHIQRAYKRNVMDVYDEQDSPPECCLSKDKITKPTKKSGESAATSMISEFLDRTSGSAFCNFEEPSAYEQENYTPPCIKSGTCFESAVSDESIGGGPPSEQPASPGGDSGGSEQSQGSQPGPSAQAPRPKSKIPQKTKTPSNKSSTEKAAMSTRAKKGKTPSNRSNKSSTDRTGVKKVKKKPPPDPKEPDNEKTKQEEEKKLEETKQDSINMLSVTISTVMLLAADIKNIPENYISWTYKYLKCIKNCQGQHPTNIKKILKMLGANENDISESNDKKCACPFTPK